MDALINFWRVCLLLQQLNTCSCYTSDIVVGADGAYSAVRQTMYKELAEKGKLSANDALPLSYDQHCLGKSTFLLFVHQCLQ